MQRRHFIQRTLAILGGMALGNPLLSTWGNGNDPAWNSQGEASRNILHALRDTGLLMALAALEANVLGGAVYALGRGVTPPKIQIGVADDRFEEACRALGNSPAVEIELWSDRLSCRHLGGKDPGPALFSPLSYLARIDSGRPAGLFRHQGLFFDVRRRRIDDPSAWLAQEKPRLELSPETRQRLGPGAEMPLELLLLAGMEKALFHIAFGADLERAWNAQLPQPVASLDDVSTLWAQLPLNRRTEPASFDLFPGAS